ncbi:unnamed protein product [Vitrella brassicaformis CCMP3155]|uniref:Uncharacterized protein n=2 Tax=Vitrella brassicaformis TaxID=1169539 RepID=A0A0G4ETA3_VITBC|nr:unnamed protein product [Vitrella brassicaformis CCMP3155]|eukprot:CEM01467.1 unnamed protein product [Vitrella brassicaformis CCMP3155]
MRLRRTSALSLFVALIGVAHCADDEFHLPFVDALGDVADHALTMAKNILPGIGDDESEPLADSLTFVSSFIESLSEKASALMSDGVQLAAGAILLNREEEALKRQVLGSMGGGQRALNDAVSSVRSALDAKRSAMVLGDALRDVNDSEEAKKLMTTLLETSSEQGGLTDPLGGFLAPLAGALMPSALLSSGGDLTEDILDKLGVDTLVTADTAKSIEEIILDTFIGDHPIRTVVDAATEPKPMNVMPCELELEDILARSLGAGELAARIDFGDAKQCTLLIIETPAVNVTDTDDTVDTETTDDTTTEKFVKLLSSDDMRTITANWEQEAEVSDILEDFEPAETGCRVLQWAENLSPVPFPSTSCGTETQTLLGGDFFGCNFVPYEAPSDEDVFVEFFLIPQGATTVPFGDAGLPTDNDPGAGADFLCNTILEEFRVPVIDALKETFFCPADEDECVKVNEE